MTTASLRPDQTRPAVRPLRLVGVAVAAAALNLAVFAMGSVADLDWHLDGGQSVSAGLVVLMTLLPFLVGGTATSAISSRHPGFRPWAAWGGLAFGILGVPMPFVAAQDTPTAVALACMHVIAGVSWFLGLTPELTHRRSPGARHQRRVTP